MEITDLGLKKPQDTDKSDLKTFIGDNMDVINQLLKERKKTSIQSTQPISPKNGDIWIDTNV